MDSDSSTDSVTGDEILYEIRWINTRRLAENVHNDFQSWSFNLLQRALAKALSNWIFSDLCEGKVAIAEAFARYESTLDVETILRNRCSGTSTPPPAVNAFVASTAAPSGSQKESLFNTTTSPQPEISEAPSQVESDTKRVVNGNPAVGDTSKCAADYGYFASATRSEMVEFDNWGKRNEKALALVLEGLSCEDVDPICARNYSARQAYRYMQAKHGSGHPGSIGEFLERFDSLQLQSADASPASIRSILDKFVQAVEQIRSMHPDHTNMQDADLKYALSLRIPESTGFGPYLQMASQNILVTFTDLTDRLYAMIDEPNYIAEHVKRSQTHTAVPLPRSSAYQDPNTTGNGKRTKYYSKKGTKSMRNNPKASKQSQVCSNCKTDHNHRECTEPGAKDCPHKVVSEQRKAHAQDRKQQTKLTNPITPGSATVGLPASSNNVSNFVLSTAATFHGSNSLEFFLCYYEPPASDKQIRVRGATGTEISIIAIGTMILQMHDSSRPVLVLPGAYYSPQLPLNLISMGLLSSQGHTCFMDKRGAKVELDGKVVLLADYQDGVCTVKVRKPANSSSQPPSPSPTANVLRDSFWQEV